MIVVALAWAASRRPPLVSLSGASLAVGAVAAVLGLAVLWFGATRPYRGLLDAHVVSSVVAVALAVVTAARRLRGTQARALRPVFWTGIALAALAAVVATALAVTRDSRRQSTYTIRNPSLPPLTMDGEGGGPSTAFFPSSIRTDTGGTVPANFFMSSQPCERCHKDIYDEWTSSAHRFSSFNNQWYRKSIEYMQDTVGTKPSTLVRGLPRPRDDLRRAPWTRRRRTRSTGPKRTRASAASRATRSCTSAARWGRATS